MKPSGPLSGLTVLDLTRARSGPTAVRQLADWGADVIMIEPPAEMDNDLTVGGRDGSDFQNLQVFADPQVRHLNMVNTLPSPHYSPLRVVGQPVHLSRTPSGVRCRPPERGEHGLEILEGLGYTPAQVADLSDRGVI